MLFFFIPFFKGPVINYNGQLFNRLVSSSACVICCQLLPAASIHVRTYIYIPVYNKALSSVD